MTRTIGRVRLDQESARIVAEELAPALDLNAYRHAVAPVADAIAEMSRPARIAKLAGSAAAAVWEDGLRAEAEAELARMHDEARVMLAQIEAAREELGRPVADNRLALALVEQLASDLADATEEVQLRLHDLEDELREAPKRERSAIAIRAALEVAGSAGVPPAERLAAAETFVRTASAEDEPTEGIQRGARELARLLATDERRLALREGVDHLVDAAREELPLLAEELSAVLAKPMPDDPADDELWRGAVLAAVTEDMFSAAFGRD